MMLLTSDTITAADLRASLPNPGDHRCLCQRPPSHFPPVEAKERAIEHFTKAYLQAKLAEYGGVITKTAETSGIPGSISPC